MSDSHGDQMSDVVHYSDMNIVLILMLVWQSLCC